MALSDEEIASVKVGTKVILGKHEIINGARNWNSYMENYVGKEATVLMMNGKDIAGCITVRVDIDDRNFSWRVRDMTIVQEKRFHPVYGYEMIV